MNMMKITIRLWVSTYNADSSSGPIPLVEQSDDLSPEMKYAIKKYDATKSRNYFWERECFEVKNYQTSRFLYVKPPYDQIFDFDIFISSR